MFMISIIPESAKECFRLFCMDLSFMLGDGQNFVTTVFDGTCFRAFTGCADFFFCTFTVRVISISGDRLQIGFDQAL